MRKLIRRIYNWQPPQTTMTDGEMCLLTGALLLLLGVVMHSGLAVLPVMLGMFTMSIGAMMK